MSRRRPSRLPGVRRCLAGFLILSLTFSQAAPAWALRGLQPEGGTPARAGLEDALGETAPASEPATFRELVPGGAEINILHATRHAFIERGDCGCFARVGKSQSQGGLSTNEVVMQAARALEPRGYQSASAGVIALGSHPSFKVRKVLGGADELQQLIEGDPLPDGNVQLVHLRWPTQGDPTIDNQHPTPIEKGQHTPSLVELIFNGDITNFHELDVELEAEGVIRPQNVTSDAWTIAALIWRNFRRPSESQVAGRAREIYLREGSIPDRDEENWRRADEELRQEGVHMSLLEAVSHAYGRLEGDYALVVVSEQEPDQAIGALRGQKPLIVGRGRTPEVGNFIGSEASTFIEYTDSNQSLKSGDIVVVKQDEVQFYRRQETSPGRFELREVPEEERPVQQLDVEEVKVSKTYEGVEYDTFTEKEIAEQADAIRRTINYQGRPNVLQARIEGKAEPMPGLKLSEEDIRDAKGLILIAMGTATYAGMAAEPYLFEDVGLSVTSSFQTQVHTGTTLYDILRGRIYRMVQKVDPSVRIPTDVQGWVELVQKYREGALATLVKHYEGKIGIAVSQSGNTMDTNQLVILLQALGVHFIGIVNKPIETPLVRLTQDDGGLFRTKAGAEVGVASTKAFVAQLTALRLLAIYMGLVRGTLVREEARAKLDVLQAIPDKIEQWLSDSANRERIRRIAKVLSTQQNIMFLSRGAEVPVSMEGALKMLELSYLFTVGMDSALMKHGFIANFPESRDPLARRFAIAILTDRVSFAEALVNLSEIRARYGRVVAIAFESDVDKVRLYADDIIAIPDVPDEMASIMAVLPLQILAVETTKAINEIGQTLASWAEGLYWKLRQRETAIRTVSDQELLDTLQDIEKGYGDLSDSGQLELLSTAKVRQVRLLIENAIRAGELGRTEIMEDGIREVIRVLRGPRLSMIMFFDHELARFTTTGVGGGEGVLTLQEHKGITRLFRDHSFKGGVNPIEVLRLLTRDLMVYLGQASERGSALKARWKDWRFDKGLGEFLGRDLDKPRGLAKEVTVDRLSERLRNQLVELGVSAESINTVFDGIQRLDGSQIREYPGAVRIIADLMAVPEGTLRRRAMMHEQAHFLIRQQAFPELLGKVGRAIDAAEVREVEQGEGRYTPFWVRFEKVFGTFDSAEQYLEEVLAKYVSTRLTDVGQDLFASVQPDLEAVLQGTSVVWTSETRQNLAAQLDIAISELDQRGKLPVTLAELFDPNYLPRYGNRGGTVRNNEVAKVMQLAHYSRALGLDPAIELSDLTDGASFEVHRLLAELRHAARAEAPLTVAAGLEDITPFEVDAATVNVEVRYAIGKTYNTKDVQADWAVLQPVEQLLDRLGVQYGIHYGDPSGISWAVRQPTGSGDRRYFQIERRPFGTLTIIPAFRGLVAGAPQRVLLVIARETATASPRYWTFPADQNLEGRLTTLIQKFMTRLPIPRWTRQLELPAALVPHQQAVGALRDRLRGRVLKRFNPNEPEIVLESAYSPQVDATVFVIMGETDQPGLVEAITGPLHSENINVLDHRPMEDHGDISYVVAQGFLPDEVLRSIDDQILSIIPLHFGRQMRSEDPLLTPEDMEVLHGASERVQQGKRFYVELSRSLYNDLHSRITVALLDLPPGDPRRQQVMASVRNAIKSENRQVLGAPLDTVYRGVRLLQLTVDNREGSETVRGAMENIERALTRLTAQAGLEQLKEGVDYRFDDDNNAVFLRSLDLSHPVVLPNGVTLNPAGGTIVIGEGTTLFKGATVKGTAVFGKQVEAGGILIGTPQEPLVVGDGAKLHRAEVNVKRTVVGPKTHINGANVSDATVVPFIRGENVVAARVDVGTTLRNHSVVFGADVGTGITIYDAHVVGAYVEIGNNSEHDEGFYWGVADEAPIKFPHHGYMETFWAMPVSVGDLEHFSDAYYDRLRTVMEAVFSGELQSIEPIEEAPISSSGVLRQAVFDLDGAKVEFPAQRINFGANTITSDYDPRTGARSSGVGMAGVASGVNAVIKLPALLAVRTLVGNLTQADGEVSMGTLLVGTSPRAALRGYRAPEQGFTLGAKIAEEVKVQMDYFRRVGITAQGALEAAKRAKDPYQLYGFVSVIRALHRQYGGISKRYGKVLSEALTVSLDNLGRQHDSEPDEKRKGRLATRIVEHVQLMKDRDVLLAEIQRIGQGIEEAVGVVAPVTQKQMADWIALQTLRSDITWANPLAAGLEQAPALVAATPAAVPPQARPVVSEPAVAAPATRAARFAPATRTGGVVAVSEWAAQIMEAQKPFQGVAFPSAAELHTSAVTFIDTTVDENEQPSPAATSIVPHLPADAVAFVRSHEDLITAEALAGKTTQATVIALDGRTFDEAVLQAVYRLPPIPGIGIRILSGRQPDELKQALRNAGFQGPLSVLAPRTLLQILTAVQAGDRFIQAFFIWFQSASDNWESLAEYL